MARSTSLSTEAQETKCLRPKGHLGEKQKLRLTTVLRSWVYSKVSVRHLGLLWHLGTHYIDLRHLGIYYGSVNLCQFFWVVSLSRFGRSLRNRPGSKPRPRGWRSIQVVVSTGSSCAVDDDVTDGAQKERGHPLLGLQLEVCSRSAKVFLFDDVLLLVALMQKPLWFWSKKKRTVCLLCFSFRAFSGASSHLLTCLWATTYVTSSVLGQSRTVALLFLSPMAIGRAPSDATQALGRSSAFCTVDSALGDDRETRRGPKELI